MEEKQPILSICIPTYNRRDVIVRDVHNYLSVQDSRFCVKVLDNYSTDGTHNALLDIRDERLIVRQNERNIGGTNNVMKSLKNTQSKYVMLILDKDGINVDYLKKYIDFLEISNPDWGYINFHCSVVTNPDVFPSGVNAIRNSSAYQPRHPSGFFVKSELYKEATDDGILEGTQDFLFPLELVQLYLALHYDCVNVNIPLIIDSNVRNTNSFGSYTYDERNCWFSPTKCNQYYQVFSNKICEMMPNVDEKKCILEEMTTSMTNAVSKRFRIWMNSDEICRHYHLKKRNVSLIEMISNLKIIMNSYYSVAKTYNSFDRKYYHKRWIKDLKSCTKFVLKEMIKGKQQVLVRI